MYLYYYAQCYHEHCESQNLIVAIVEQDDFGRLNFNDIKEEHKFQVFALLRAPITFKLFLSY